MPTIRLPGAHHANCPRTFFPHPNVECTCADWDALGGLGAYGRAVMLPTVRLALFHATLPSVRAWLRAIEAFDTP